MPLTVSSSSPPSSISPPFSISSPLSSISSPLPSTKSPSLPKPPPRIPLATTPNVKVGSKTQETAAPDANRDHVRFSREVFTSIEKIRIEQNQQRRMLETLLDIVQELGASKASSSSTFSLPEGITLPLQSLEDVEGLEKELRQQTVLNNMVNYLSLIGGKNTPDMVRRILSHVIKSRLAESYNWYGKKGKLKFGSLKIAEVICKAVQKTTTGTTTAEVEFITREWLRTAKDREGGRKNRKAATNTSSENLEN